MTDWATVALSSIGSLGTVLLHLFLERRRETVQHLAAAERRMEAMDGRVRTTEQEVAALRSAGELFTELATGELKRRVRAVGGR